MSMQTLYRFSRYTELALITQRSIQENSDYLNAGYYNTGLFVTLSHFWHYFNVTSYLAFSYYNNNYISNSPDPNTGEIRRRNDNVTSFGVGLSRPITPWLRVRVDYLYYNQGSNFSFLSYNDNKFLFGLQSSF
jgi:hypothetical protein